MKDLKEHKNQENKISPKEHNKFPVTDAPQNGELQIAWQRMKNSFKEVQRTKTEQIQFNEVRKTT